MEAKDAELKTLLEMKHLDLEEMKERLNNQEKERQSELLQLQLEVSESLHRVPSASVRPLRVIRFLHITTERTFICVRMR